MNPTLGKLLILLGVVFIGIGILFLFNIRIPWLGRLPGDIAIEKGNFKFYFPLGSCILISLILTLLFYLFRR